MLGMGTASSSFVLLALLPLLMLAHKWLLSVEDIHNATTFVELSHGNTEFFHDHQYRHSDLSAETVLLTDAVLALD